MINFKKICLLSVFAFLLFSTEAQENKLVYFEKVTDSLMRFYFDNYYYLAEKNCPFKSIERVTGFNKETNTFEGNFKDFGPTGHVILTGTHTNGVKTGPFIAYHPNGKIKWEATFADGQPVNDWKFYYPDGRPMMVLNYEQGVRIMSQWDRKGKQIVKDGEGLYDFTIPFEGYSEYGYPMLRRRGRVKSGVPADRWEVYFVDEKNNSVLAADEYFSGGVFKRGDNYFTEDSYSQSDFPVLPVEYFVRAEYLVFKKCNFDDYSNFTNYLSEKIEKSFDVVKLTFKIVPGNFEYTAKLSEAGKPSRITFTKMIEDAKTQNILSAIIEVIPYYFPSLKNNLPVNDTIVVSGRLEVNEAGEIDVHSISIKRPAEE
ncbi:toxin-antitoxin system YwqK family antitoxin [Sphingobacterium spiritivorum]|uniref:toxin-antitoxin system YwqK family antitoxin n=1 Tax=Sphingobacterium spiritivorum TaxID=258 RepID=UPI003DA50675